MRLTDMIAIGYGKYLASVAPLEEESQIKDKIMLYLKGNLHHLDFNKNPYSYFNTLIERWCIVERSKLLNKKLI